MRRWKFPIASLFLALLLYAPNCPAQDETPELRWNNNSIEWFNEAANFHQEGLLFKALQYEAPYPGFYQATTLTRNGIAFAGRVVPNWAVQNSIGAKLDDQQLEQVK